MINRESELKKLAERVPVALLQKAKEQGTVNVQVCDDGFSWIFKSYGQEFGFAFDPDEVMEELRGFGSSKK